jgi:hypothetical protein
MLSNVIEKWICLTHFGESFSCGISTKCGNGLRDAWKSPWISIAKNWNCLTAFDEICHRI